MKLSEQSEMVKKGPTPHLLYTLPAQYLKIWINILIFRMFVNEWH